MIIRETQIKALERVSIDNFVLGMSAHCRDFSPQLCKTLKEEELESAVREGIARAETHGFTQRGPVRFYLDLMIVFGSGFDTDPQYTWAAEILTQKEEMTQMQRSEALHEKTVDYLENVDGEKNEYTLQALQELSDRLKAGLTFDRENFGENMLSLMKEVHPRKCKETGEEALRQLIKDGRQKAIREFEFKEPRAVALVVVLAFAFGHRFDADPFLPWISRNLQKETELPETKAEALERRAVIWLEAVLKNAEENK
jgi:hypothetical protein